MELAVTLLALSKERSPHERLGRIAKGAGPKAEPDAAGSCPGKRRRRRSTGVTQKHPESLLPPQATWLHSLGSVWLLCGAGCWLRWSDPTWLAQVPV